LLGVIRLRFRTTTANDDHVACVNVNLSNTLAAVHSFVFAIMPFSWLA